MIGGVFLGMGLSKFHLLKQNTDCPWVAEAREGSTEERVVCPGLVRQDQIV